MTGSRFQGIYWVLAAIILGQYIGNGAMAMARTGSVKQILPLNLFVVLIIIVIAIALEFIALKMETKGGGYQE